VNVLDQVAGIAVTDSSGVLQTPITNNSTNWDTAYTDRLKWDGGATGLVAATGRTSLGLVIGTNVQAWDADLDTWGTKTPTTVGGNLVTLTNPSVISFIKIAADNSVSTRTPAQVLSDIGAQASGSYAASGANSDITSISSLTSFGTGSVATKFNSTGVLQLGGTTSSFPGLKRNTTQVNLRLADDSDDASLIAKNAQFAFDGIFSFGGFTNLAMGGVDGNLVLRNSNATTWGLLQFGGTTSSFPAIKRSSTTIAFRLADDSADANITAAAVIASKAIRLKGYTVSTLPASPTQGDMAFVTDGLTPTYNATAVGGGAIVVPVFYNGTTWTFH
jgi:hypothetical protein